MSEVLLQKQPSALDQIANFRFSVSWLVETNLPLPDETLLKFQGWIWSVSPCSHPGTHSI